MKYWRKIYIIFTYGVFACFLLISGVSAIIFFDGIQSNGGLVLITAVLGFSTAMGIAGAWVLISAFVLLIRFGLRISGYKPHGTLSLISDGTKKVSVFLKIAIVILTLFGLLHLVLLFAQ